ncbi:MAG: hypothetical protein NUW00_01345 [Candidatus Kaiserbacteria bacterium]|nr:hypothetical protein [Candidatus Kaiserbacteria bacterium]
MIARTLSPFLSIIVAIVLFVFFIKPTYYETSVLRDDAREYREAASSYIDFTEILKQKIEEKEKYTSGEKKLNLLIPEEIDSTQLLVDLKSLANRNGLLFGNIVVVEGEALGMEEGNEDSVIDERARLVPTDISFELIGTYSQFKSFLEDLESSQVLFEVTALTFDTTEQKMFQQFSFTVRTYALPSSNTSL